MTAGEIAFYFLLYALFGWLLENVYNLFTQGEFWKEGFMKGPFKPMYGVAPVLLLWLVQVGGGHRLLLTGLLCLIIPTVVEGVSGCLLLMLFGRRWWDYSGLCFQLGGHICLKFSLYWGVLSVFTLKVVHPLAEQAYRSVSPVWPVVGPALLLLFAIDLAWTCLTRRREYRGSLI
ncbi:putative ABC transporter permease [Paenibacillus sp. FSL K6-2441]|uniref:putative ABC transporter permease n=1 Tax=Paenibacillus sp. FSL K6-2441 TaxID=2954679 RepID=UPI0030D766CE